MPLASLTVFLASAHSAWVGIGISVAKALRRHQGDERGDQRPEQDSAHVRASVFAEPRNYVGASRADQTFQRQRQRRKRLDLERLARQMLWTSRGKGCILVRPAWSDAPREENHEHRFARATNIAIPFDQDARRPGDGRRRARRAAGQLQAQCPVPARRLQVHLLRGDGCDRPQPLSAGADLREGPARACRLSRQPHGDGRASGAPVLDAIGADQLLGHGRRGEGRRRASEEDRAGQGAASATSRRSCRPTPMWRCATRCPTPNSSTRPMRWSASAPSRRRPRSTSCGWRRS